MAKSTVVAKAAKGHKGGARNVAVAAAQGDAARGTNGETKGPAHGQVIGYCRSSTLEQVAGLDAQGRDVTAAGATKVFREMVSSVARREQLETALDYVRDGDVLVVTKLDRLARSTADLLAIVARLEAKGVGLIVLAMSGGGRLDTRSPTGRLMVTLLGAVAEFERSLMIERQVEGIARAKAEGKYKGRTPTVKRQSAEILRLRTEGRSPTQIARQLKVARSSVYRVMEGAAGASG